MRNIYNIFKYTNLKTDAPNVFHERLYGDLTLLESIFEICSGFLKISVFLSDIRRVTPIFIVSGIQFRKGQFFFEETEEFVWIWMWGFHFPF